MTRIAARVEFHVGLLHTNRLVAISCPATRNTGDIEGLHDNFTFIVALETIVHFLFCSVYYSYYSVQPNDFSSCSCTASHFPKHSTEIDSYNSLLGSPILCCPNAWRSSCAKMITVVSYEPKSPQTRLCSFTHLYKAPCVVLCTMKGLSYDVDVGVLVLVLWCRN